MSHLSNRTIYRMFVACIAMAMWLVTPLDGLAQEPDPAYDLQIGVTGEAVGDVPSQSVGVMVFNEDRTVDFGSCPLVTDAIPGGCTVDVPVNATVLAEIDESTLPEGVGLAENPITYTTPDSRTGLGDFSFEFVYIDDGGEEPVLDYDLQLMLSGDPVGDIPDQTVAVTVLNEDQSVEYGNCLMDLANKPGGCSMNVPANTVVTAVLDASTLPDGIVVLENPLWYTTPAEKTQVGDIWFELAYADRGDEEPGDGDTGETPETPSEPEAPVDQGGATQLPTTGSGPASTPDQPINHVMVALTSGLALLMGVGSMLVQASRKR